MHLPAGGPTAANSQQGSTDDDANEGYIDEEILPPGSIIPPSNDGLSGKDTLAVSQQAVFCEQDGGDTVEGDEALTDTVKDAPSGAEVLPATSASQQFNLVAQVKSFCYTPCCIEARVLFCHGVALL